MQKPIELQWPFKGLNESQAYVRQRGGQPDSYTTAKCNNVVGFDPRTGRNRGAARAGLTKYCPDRIDGASAGQCLVYSVGSVFNGTRVTGDQSVPPSETRVTALGVARVLGAATLGTVGARATTLVGISGGNAALITSAGVQDIDSGSDVLSPSRSVIFAEAFFDNIYFCDGASYKYYDTGANLMVTWDATTAGSIPAQAASVQLMTGATNTTPIVVTVNSHGLSPGDLVTITGVVGNDAANGTWTIANITLNTFELVGSGGGGAYVSDGTVTRVSGSRCSLIAVWGGRIVLSGLETDPNNIFMSAVGDPFDWDYSPAAQTVQQAVAGNITSGYGKNADIVTALIPYTDDVMLIGGTHSIRKFLGNPAEGGINVSVTDITGVAYGRAWCQSPEGVIYFFGSRGGVYKIDPENGIPNRLTALTIDERLADVDLSASVVTLEWDDRSLSVRVYITPTSGGPTTNYVWDVRNEAWWPFTYANNSHNPMSVRLLSGDAAADRSLLEYGQDGYVRILDEDASTDDGDPIDSFVYLGPLSNMLITELQATLSEQSGDVTWSFCTASSLERALTASPRAVGRFSSGRNANQWPRGFIEHGYIRLSATGPWAIEMLTAGVERVSETMQRVMRSTP